MSDSFVIPKKEGQKAIDTIAMHIHKVEQLQAMVRSTNNLIEHETKLLHKALEKGMQLGNGSLDTNSGISLRGGGQNKG